MEERATEILAQIHRSLQVIAGALAKAPNMHKPLGDFPSFDWESIGAQALRSDADGVSIVEHNGRIYKRRAPDNKFEPCIWFSRCTGKAADGANEYETLITFEVIKDDVEPIGSKARKALQSQRKPATHSTVPPAGNQDNVLPIQPKKLTVEEMNIRAGELVRERKVACAGDKCTVQANNKTSYDVTRGENKKLVCQCERFGLQRDCEHVRAVRLHYSTPRPDGKTEVSMLTADLKAAGMKPEDVDALLAKLCDGLFDPAQMDVAQIQKAKKALQFKLEELNAKKKAA